MKPEQIVQLVARLIAVYLLVGVVVPNISWLPSLSQPVGPLLMTVFLISAVAALLWLYPWVLSIGILPKESKNKTASPVTLEAVQTLCFAILGTYFCVQAAAPLLQEVFFIMRDAFYGVKVHWDHLWGGPCVKFLLGLWVMFSGRGLMGFITRLRNISPRSPLE
jgi:hypothetical protein